MKKILIILAVILAPMIVLGVGSTKRIIELPGFNANRALIVNGSNEVDESTVTSTELGYLSGATASVLTEASTIPLIQLEALTSNNIVITDNAGVLANSFVDSSKVDYLAPVNTNLCGIDDTCTLTNKTLTSPVANLITLDGLTATPSTPSSGDVRFYSKSADEKLYFLNSAGIEQEVGTGATSSNNYFADFNADQISNLTQFDDTSSGGDLDGGTATNLTVSSNTSTPINKLRSYRISKAAANASWEGQRITFSGTQIDELAKSGKPFIFSFNYETSANYNAGTEAVSIYYYRVGVDSSAQVCNGRTLSGSVSNTLGVATTAQQFSCSFNLTSATTAVRIAWVVTGTGTSTWDLDIDNIYFGPDFQVPGVIEFGPISFTPTLEGNSSDPTLGTGGTAVGTYSRIGSRLFVSFRFVAGTTPGTGSSYYFIPLPNGLTFASSVSEANAVGTARVFNSGVTDYPNLNVAANVANHGLVINFDGNYVGQNVPAANWWTSGDIITGQAEVEISGWQNQSASLSTTQVDFSTITAKYKGDPASATAGNPIIVPTKVDDDFNAYSTSTGLFTAPGSGKIKIYGTAVSACTGGISIDTYKNGSAADTPLGYLDSNGEVTFNGYLEGVKSGDTVSIRPSTTCDFQAMRLHFEYIPNFSTFGVYGLYEYTEAECSATTTYTTGGTVYDVTGASVVLTPGTWNICYSSNFFNDWVSGTAVGQVCKAVIRDGSNNLINGTAAMTFDTYSSDNDNDVRNMSHCAEVTITSTTTYKLSGQCQTNSSSVTSQTYCGSGFSASITDPDAEPKIWARRMK